MEEDRLLNAKGLAQALNVSPPTITEWLKAGKITAEIREGRVIRFSLSAVKSQLAKRAAGKQPRPGPL